MGVTFIGAMKVQENKPRLSAQRCQKSTDANRQRIVVPSAFRFGHRQTKEAVLDASALLAFLRDEPGTDKVAAVLTGSGISAVNLAETISKMVERGKPLAEVSSQIERLQITVTRFDAVQARMVASLWKATRVCGRFAGRPRLPVPGLANLPAGPDHRSRDFAVANFGTSR